MDTLTDMFSDRRISSYLLPLLLVSTGVYGFFFYTSVKTPFANPISYTMNGDCLYLLEKKKNTILQLSYSKQNGLRLVNSIKVEEDDDIYYYMVRKIHNSQDGLITHSYIYKKHGNDFVGYRFREYNYYKNTYKDILTILLTDPARFEEFNYCQDSHGNHFFAHNITGRLNIWTINSGKNALVKDGVLPKTISELGEINSKLASWSAIYVDDNNKIYMISNVSGNIIQYSKTGKRIGEIGKAGFADNELLAPDELSAKNWDSHKNEFVVANTGNRTWLTFSDSGNIIKINKPLTSGYPHKDILTGPVFYHSKEKTVCSFDLANKCFVTHDTFQALSFYVVRKPVIQFSCIGLILLVILLFSYKKQLLCFFQTCRIPFFVKLLAFFLPLLILSGLFIGKLVKDMMRSELESEYVLRSANLAKAIINTISVEDLDKIQKPADRESEAYERLYRTANLIIDTQSVPHTPKWIIHKIKNQRFYYGINIWRGPIYEPVILPADRTIFYRVLEEKKNLSGRYQDDQGEWFSYLTPIITGNCEEASYVLELYRSTETIDRIARNVTVQILRLVSLTVLIAVLLAFLVSYLFTRPLKALLQGTKIVSKGNFEHTIVVNSRDELNTLANSFNSMVKSLKQYTRKLARTTAQKERILSELRFASEVQQGVLPTNFPPYKGVEQIYIEAKMIPAREVGGDFYDFFKIDSEHMGIVVADVSGKGMAAGLFMVLARTLLRNNALNNFSPAKALSKTNRILANDNPTTMFVTIIYLICNLKTGEVIYCNGGHHQPIHLIGDKAEEIPFAEDALLSMPLGVFESTHYTDYSLKLNRGESLLLFTDGILEQVDRDNQEYGKNKLLNLLNTKKRKNGEKTSEMIVNDVLKFRGDAKQFDDITLLILTRLAKESQ